MIWSRPGSCWSALEGTEWRIAFTLLNWRYKWMALGLTKGENERFHKILILIRKIDFAVLTERARN